jgi:hypothetical protein
VTVDIAEGYSPGCIGRVAQLHAACHAVRHRFGVAFEAKAARELADFCLGYVRGRDASWLAQAPDITGSIAISAQVDAVLHTLCTSQPCRRRPCR